MEPRDRGKDHDKIAERWLDAAIKQYGEAEPRTGLEGRVLANLQAQREQVLERRNWWPTMAGIAAIVLLGTAVFIVKDGLMKDGRRVKREAFTERGDTPSVRSVDSAGQATPMLRNAVRRKLTTRVKETAEPRLAQFPSPRPLSEQEKMLLRYVRERPQEAILVAQAQAEQLKQDSLELEKEKGSTELAPDSTR